jgi:hypothetical protein
VRGKTASNSNPIECPFFVPLPRGQTSYTPNLQNKKKTSTPNPIKKSNNQKNRKQKGGDHIMVTVTLIQRKKKQNNRISTPNSPTKSEASEAAEKKE